VGWHETFVGFHQADSPFRLQPFKILWIIFLQPVAAAVKFFDRLEKSTSKPIQPANIDIEFGGCCFARSDEQVIVGVTLIEVGIADRIVPKSVLI